MNIFCDIDVFKHLVLKLKIAICTCQENVQENLVYLER